MKRSFSLFVLAFCLIASVSQAQLVPIHYWNFDSGTLTDEVTGNPATLSGNAPLQVQGKLGDAYLFDGTTYNLGNIITDQMGEFSIAFWYQPQAYAPTGFSYVVSQFLLDFDLDAAIGPIFEYGAPTRQTHGILHQHYVIDSLPDTTLSLTDLRLNTMAPLNAWYHIVYTFNGTTVAVYVNGQLFQSETVSPQAVLGNNADMILGDRMTVNNTVTNPSQASFVGKLDELYVFGNGLNQAEVDSLYGLLARGETHCTFASNLTSFWFRPGFDFNQYIDLSNWSANPLSGLFYFVPDASLTYDSIVPPPAYTNGDTLFWEIDSLLFWGNYQIYLAGNIPVSTPLGTQYHFLGGIIPTGCDSIVFTYGIDDTVTVVGSYDPNDKLVFPAGGVDPSQWLDYTIRFQNTGTAEAVNIVIRDTLDPLLQWSTFQVTGASHPYTYTRQEASRAVAFTFSNIMLPDSNANEPESHGYVRYRIRVSNSFGTSDVVENTASIYFDFNAPIVTNTTETPHRLATASREVLVSNGSLSMWPNPATGILNVALPNQAISHIQVLNLNGQIVANANIDNTSATVDVQDLPAGIYVVRALGTNGQLYFGRIVVSH